MVQLTPTLNSEGIDFIVWKANKYKADTQEYNKTSLETLLLFDILQELVKIRQKLPSRDY